MVQCSSHDMFQKFLEQGLSNVNDRLAAIVEALHEQNIASEKKFDYLVERQGERRELCGKRGAEIVALQQSDASQWEELRLQRETNAEMNKVLWKREGAMVLLAGLFSAGVTVLARFLFH